MGPAHIERMTRPGRVRPHVRQVANIARAPCVAAPMRNTPRFVPCDATTGCSSLAYLRYAW
eukprot:25182-Eustigmatos_ZCMA.PRE.1